MHRTAQLASLCLIFLLLLTTAPLASVQDDMEVIGELESASQEKSLALLAVIKSMGPRLEESSGTMEMARIVSVSCTARENRMPESRILKQLNINNEYRVLEHHDTLLLIDLQDGRLGWIDETNVQLFDAPKPDAIYFTKVEPKVLRRYAIVTAELMDGIEDDMAMAQEIYDASQPLPDSNMKTAIEASYRRIVEYHGYAAFFHKKYILNYDFTMESGRPFMETLSGWAELLLGTSKFETKSLDAAGAKITDEQSSSLISLGLGGDVEINDRSTADVSFHKRNEVIQTPYSTTTLDVGYNRQRDNDGELDLGFGMHKFADDVNTFNDFSEMSFEAGTLINKEDRNYRLGYDFLNHGYDVTDTDDFQSHALLASTRIKRGRGKTLNASLRAVLESSDVAFHDFKHFTPTVESVTRTRGGLKSWKGQYEVMSYADANLRSYRRAQVMYRKNDSQGPRRNRTSYALTHKQYPDNDATTYLQLKANMSRNLIGENNRRLSGTTYTNFYPDNSDNNYTDLRLSLNRSTELRSRDINLYTRLWHKPGDTDGPTPPKPYIIDLFGKYGITRGHLRFGPTLGMHLLAAKGSKVFKQDGNLMRLGAVCEGFFQMENDIRITLDASYDYGFVYSDKIIIDPNTGTLTSDDTASRHPTTFQLNAFGSMPLSPEFDLTAKIGLYRIATDMDSETSINPVTNNNHFTVFVGVRYRYN
jgi:hypothetical protein